MIFKNENTGETVEMTVEQILQEINRDRSEEWTLYNTDDWIDGLIFTEYKLIEN